MIIDPLDGVAVFLAVAEHRSFTGAALSLGVTPTAVSKAVRALEARQGVMLFQRTTRRVALTEAGQAVFLRLRPAVSDIADAFAALGGFRDRPMGTLRITAPHGAVEPILGALVPAFRRAYPEVTLEISLDEAIVDLVDAGFDAGIRLGEAVEKDMVAVRLTPEIAWCVVGAPDYFKGRDRPRAPEDLVRHEALHYRFAGSGALHRWRFRRGKRDFLVETKSGLVLNDRQMLVHCAVQGLGLAFVSEREARQPLAQGQLEAFLQPWIPVDSGLYLYFPERSQSQLKLRVFIDMALKLAALPA
ncbi:LysR family transcriptional regulator [Variovorax sp. H27-G14]|uniref:LysR family transcriptional regulator n=1 Tax=Variovorax sp. H27-G14 TaxID=3111914 RepID=UPI0038FD0352